MLRRRSRHWDHPAPQLSRGRPGSAELEAPPWQVAGYSDQAAVDSPAVRAAVAHVEATSGSDERVLLRPADTEQFVRVVVEAGAEHQAGELAEQVAEVAAAS